MYLFQNGAIFSTGTLDVLLKVPPSFLLLFLPGKPCCREWQDALAVCVHPVVGA